MVLSNKKGETSSTASGIIILALIIFAIWFFFIRVDYKDVWWKGTEYQRVVYCGPIGESDCQNGNSYSLPVTHLERNGDTHWFVIKFDNGGSVKAYGNCMKDESNLYPGVERYCYATTTNSENGRLYTYLITK